jgi:hypothetical protein
MPPQRPTPPPDDMVFLGRVHVGHCACAGWLRHPLRTGRGLREHRRPRVGGAQSCANLRLGKKAKQQPRRASDDGRRRALLRCAGDGPTHLTQRSPPHQMARRGPASSQHQPVGGRGHGRTPAAALARQGIKPAARRWPAGPTTPPRDGPNCARQAEPACRAPDPAPWPTVQRARRRRRPIPAGDITRTSRAGCAGDASPSRPTRRLEPAERGHQKSQDQGYGEEDHRHIY